MTTERQPWQFLTKCKLCEDVIYSRHDGEYRSCKCGAIAVDQTPHYSRFIGEPANFVKVNEQNRTT